MSDDTEELNGASSSGREHHSQQGGEGKQLSPYERVADALHFAIMRVEPGEAVPEVPPQLKEWAENTTLGMFAGMLYCGGRQFVATRREGHYTPPDTGLSGPQVARLIAEENTRRLLRLGNEMLRGGLRFGALTGLFYGIQLLSSTARNRRDMADTIYAALATGAAMGTLSVPGSAGSRLRSGVLGAALGGLVAVPASLLQRELQGRLNDGQTPRHTDLSGGVVPTSQQYTPERYTVRNTDAVASIIAQMEHSMQHSPHRDKERL